MKLNVREPLKHTHASLEASKGEFAIWRFGMEGGSLQLFAPSVIEEYRYMVGCIKVLETHCATVELRIYNKSQQHGKRYRFGVLPGIRTKICVDLSLINSVMSDTNRKPGMLKFVVQGYRMNVDDIGYMELGIHKCFHDVRIELSDFQLTNREPVDYELTKVSLVDEFGQWEQSDWPGKIHSEEEYQMRFENNPTTSATPIGGWDKWGGDKQRHLCNGSGFFKTLKTTDGRWHLVDPDGNEFFSMGADCMNPGTDARVDLFSLESIQYPLVSQEIREACTSVFVGTRTPSMPVDHRVSFDYPQAFLMKFYRNQWKEKWEQYAEHVMTAAGLNTVGNWSDPIFMGRSAHKPYVRPLKDFPSTKLLIFRDFPDVFSKEYADNSVIMANELQGDKDNPWMIGYFLLNEPQFTCIPNLRIANEVFHDERGSECKKFCIKWLKDKYETVERLNEQWHAAFGSFNDLVHPVDRCDTQYPDSGEDIRQLSVLLLEQYVRVPAEACRAVDPNHLNLGFRWAIVLDKEMTAGWQYYDVFSFNCYEFDPTERMQMIKDMGIDRPYLIGEFHFGALDRGLPSTGLKGVRSQADRAKAYRYYLEHFATFPNAIGAHWFQFMDQSCIGRFDGENYQVGLVDICQQPYDETIKAARETSEVIYAVKNGEQAPYNQPPDVIPMIAF